MCVCVCVCIAFVFKLWSFDVQPSKAVLMLNDYESEGERKGKETSDEKKELRGRSEGGGGREEEKRK